MTLPGYRTHGAAPTRWRGLAVASLVLGLAGIPALAICGLGLLLGVAGLALGITALLRGAERDLAIAGIVASAVALILGTTVIVWLVSQAAKCGDAADYPDALSRDRCIEREFPFVQSSARPGV
ncbi:hypothetical protein [Actinomadura sp. HBU206391]|uniref:hypothetical protein n=1 Tax=Actinomadura sp. HBU206391 TaxID=2731692 RepID=UPI0016505713|nr:hypothetical protein [Actinomadura sp. HBU206391]MBC6457435.1 hypothetical protein [Actinomadura sp. HBU206391]